MIVLSKNSIESKVRREAIERASVRRQEDIRKGLAKADGPQRGDFKETRYYDKIMQDYRNFKSLKDREKIREEYFIAQKENRRS